MNLKLNIEVSLEATISEKTTYFVKVVKILLKLFDFSSSVLGIIFVMKIPANTLHMFTVI